MNRKIIVNKQIQMEEKYMHDNKDEKSNKRTSLVRILKIKETKRSDKQGY